MNVFGIRRGFYQKNEEILSTPLPLNAPAVRPPLNSFFHHGGTERGIAKEKRGWDKQGLTQKISRKGAKWMTTKYTKNTKILQKRTKKTKGDGWNEYSDTKQHQVENIIGKLFFIEHRRKKSQNVF
jgi:hypothetical protein